MYVYKSSVGDRMYICRKGTKCIIYLDTYLRIGVFTCIETCVYRSLYAYNGVSVYSVNAGMLLSVYRVLLHAKQRSCAERKGF